MLKKTITYVDYNGTERKEDFYFNLTETEFTKITIKTPGGLGAHIDRIIKNNDGPAILDLFDSFVLGAYGEKSEDGRRFIKSKEISEAFSQTEAYNVLFEELATNEKACVDFIKALLPKKYVDQLNK